MSSGRGCAFPAILHVPHPTLPSDSPLNMYGIHSHAWPLYDCVSVIVTFGCPQAKRSPTVPAPFKPFPVLQPDTDRDNHSLLAL